MATFLAGCSSYTALTETGKNPNSYQRFFVKSNFDDNHGIDGRIVQTLQSRGLTVEKGPLTMMPLNTQVLVSYEDHWGWDFRTHLTGLRILLSDAKSEKPIARGEFTGPAAMGLSVDEAVERTLNKILGAPKKK